MQIPASFLGRSTSALTESTQDEVGVFPHGAACEVAPEQAGPAPSHHGSEPVSEAATHAQANAKNTGISGFLVFSPMLLQFSWFLPNGEQKAFMKPQTSAG